VDFGSRRVAAMATRRASGVGDPAGPDLRPVTSRREYDWLTEIQHASVQDAGAEGPAPALSALHSRVLMRRLGLSDNNGADVIVYQETQSAPPSGARVPSSRAPLDRCIKSKSEAFWIGYLKVPNCVQ